MKRAVLSGYIFILFFASCSHPKYKNPHVLIETNFGDIEVELYPGKAPKSVSAFLSYVDSGFYKKSSFYRVLKEENQPSASFKSELIQGGIWQTNYKKGVSLPGIPHEPTNKTGRIATCSQCFESITSIRRIHHHLLLLSLREPMHPWCFPGGPP